MTFPWHTKKIILILIFCSLSLQGCKQSKSVASLPPQEKKQPSPLPNKTPRLPLEVRKNENIQNQISPVVIGNVITENQSSLAFLNSGTIEKIYVKAGEHVKSGQMLASLISTQENVNMIAAQIKIKQKYLALELEKKKLERITAQFQGGVVNRATLESEKNNYESILLDLQEAKNDFEGKKYNLKMTKIFAPYEGIISQKNKSVGDFVSGGEIVFQITQNKNMEIYAQIPGIYFNKLQPGMKLKISSSTNKNEVGEIEIRKVIPVLDKNSRTFDLYAKLSQFKGKLNPGDFVEINL